MKAVPHPKLDVREGNGVNPEGAGPLFIGLSGSRAAASLILNPAIPHDPTSRDTQRPRPQEQTDTLYCLLPHTHTRTHKYFTDYDL